MEGKQEPVKGLEEKQWCRHANNLAASVLLCLY